MATDPNASALFELTDARDKYDVAYPPILCALENQLLAARYLDDELVEQCIAASQKRDQRGPYRPDELPPMLLCYLELRGDGVRPSHMRVNGRKLRKYSTAKRDDLITRLLGGATTLKARRVILDPIEKEPRLVAARKLAAQILKMKPKSVQRRWAEINPNKSGRGRPRKK